MKNRSLIVLGLAALGGAAFLKSQNTPTSGELDRVYQLAMSPTMQSVAELQWASALLRSHGRSGQADLVDMKWQAIKASPVPVSVPAGFVTGHHYTGRVQLSGLEAAFASTSDVAKGVQEAIGMPVTVESLGSGAYLVSGVWTGAPAPYPVPLPDHVQWIRDDTTGEVLRTAAADAR
jgi:hypothetical protein